MGNSKVNRQNLTIALVFESIMSVFYVAFAYVLIFTEIFGTTISKDFRLPLGILLVIYGGFRIYRAIRKIKQAQRNETK